MRAALFQVLAVLIALSLAGSAAADSRVNMVFFASGSHELTRESKRTIAAVFKYYARRPAFFSQVGIEGHTDCAEAKAGSGLGERRALAVHSYIVELNIPLRGVSIRDRKDRWPLVQLQECIGEPQNRRVDWSYQD